MAYDPVDRYVLFLGYPSGSWIFSQNNWSKLSGEPVPCSSYDFGLTFFTFGNGVLFFGASEGPTCVPSSSNQTWLFVRGMWTHLNPLVSPPAQTQVNLVDDAVDGYAVLLNDYAQNSDPCTTWLFSHGSWLHLCPSKSPTPRSGAFMVYDSKDRYVVLVGGYGCTNSLCLTVGILNDTWKFTGRNWTQLTTPVTLAPILWGAAVTYDGIDGYVILYASSWVYISGSHNLLTGVTWKFANGNWSQFNSSAPGVAGFVIGYDGATASVMLFGKTCGGAVSWPGYTCDETWSYSGGNWTDRTVRPPSVPGTSSVVLAYDWADHYVVAYLTYSQQTWIYRGGNWSHLGHTGSSPGRVWALTYDSADGYLVGLSQGTWRFLNGTWTQASATDPGANWTAPGVTYDDRDHYVVLFGSGMWNYSKGLWTNLSNLVPFGLTARQWPVMANDSADGYVLLFGGYNAALGKVYNDSWKYAGGLWTNITTPSDPTAQLYPRVMAYDSSLRVVVLVALPLYGQYAGTWAFERGVWKNLHPSLLVAPPHGVNSWGGFAFDLFDNYLILGPTMTYEPVWTFGIPKLYVATVKETGLPSGQNWSATFAAGPSPMVSGRFTGTHGSVSIPNGTFTVLVKGPVGFALKSQPTFLVVAGSARTIGVIFQKTFTVRFHEQGLLPGTSWSIDVGGVTQNSTQANITFILLNGSYGFTVGPVTGKTVLPAFGTVRISGSNLTVLARFS